MSSQPPAHHNTGTLGLPGLPAAISGLPVPSALKQQQARQLQETLRALTSAQRGGAGTTGAGPAGATPGGCVVRSPFTSEHARWLQAAPPV
jgi:hypothetical protein